MVLEPVPAVAGLNVFPETPGPLKVPPDGDPVSVMEEPFTQTGPYEPALTVGSAFTTMVVEALFVQPFAFV